MAEPVKYDLKKRTLGFAKEVLLLCKSTKQTIITRPIISQLIRSATSIGANYCEATNGASKKDFRNKIFICKKESEETKYWLELLGTEVGTAELKSVSQESLELLRIFQKIISSTKP